MIARFLSFCLFEVIISLLDVCHQFTAADTSCTGIDELHLSKYSMTSILVHWHHYRSSLHRMGVIGSIWNPVPQSCPRLVLSTHCIMNRNLLSAGRKPIQKQQPRIEDGARTTDISVGTSFQSLVASIFWRNGLQREMMQFSFSDRGAHDTTTHNGHVMHTLCLSMWPAA